MAKTESLKNAEIGRIKRTKRYRSIRECLQDQLERNGNNHEYFTDLVDDYMSMWVTKELLIQDIEERGVRVKYDNGGGQSGWKKNESVDQLMKLNAQMLKLLSELKLSSSNNLDGDFDESL